MNQTVDVFLAGVVLGLAIGIAIPVAWGRFGRRSKSGVPDALTGLPGRAAGQAVLDDLRVGDAVVMIDLDRLKATNDDAGHAAGDALLSALASHLAHGVRGDDTVVRWGGDEFVVVLRAGGADAAQVIERLRASAPAAFSAGTAVHAQGAGATTLARADAALLAAKRAGGEQVVAG